MDDFDNQSISSIFKQDEYYDIDIFNPTCYKNCFLNTLVQWSETGRQSVLYIFSQQTLVYHTKHFIRLLHIKVKYIKMLVVVAEADITTSHGTIIASSVWCMQTSPEEFLCRYVYLLACIPSCIR